MKIVLATGIYPPAIGGPATYVENLARELHAAGHEVTVVTYGNRGLGVGGRERNVVSVPLGFPILRWFAYARVLRREACNADIVYAFSSVSCGIPLWLSGVRKPKRVLRLGGDFLWERYTERGGQKSLREWYGARGWLLVISYWLLRQYDHIVFSTEFQKQIYEEHYRILPKHSVIENAMEPISQQQYTRNQKPYTPFRLLFMGRFVGFKNLFALIGAMTELQDCVLTLVGEGPLDDALRDHAEELNLHHKVRFVGPVHGEEKRQIFARHDLLVLPSLTEISPNTALEAAASGLPVLLTEEHGLSEQLLSAIDVAPLQTPSQIAVAVRDVREACAGMHHPGYAERPWNTVMKEHLNLFATLGDFSPKHA
ncbi:glycosyltransferase family 4 protein [Candidatus Peregrinibacteria bacterium]|nr:glycosyltransferase family 4 protein [Candidatus Peregrinibacteria bacterium]